MISDNLTALRRLNGMSQEELAEKIGVSRQTVSKYETGESLPDIEKCRLISEVFGISIDDLVNFDSSKNMGLNPPPKGKYMFGLVKVGEKGQVVIPAKARKVFDIKPGDNLVFLGDSEQGIAIIKEESIMRMLDPDKG